MEPIGGFLLMTCAQTNGIYECDDLTDVISMVFNPLEGRQYTGFNTPTPQDLERIEPGNVVKVSRDINKIFIEITENDSCEMKLIGRVVLGDLEDQPFQVDDYICISYRNVYSISEDLRCI